ncbi:hypothetical protein BH09ACT10_BH09ACT10_08310 [soil metagenome]
MLRPTPGELLLGIQRELKSQVLPELPAGAAARQLRAALYALEQVARTWDLQATYAAADNEDLEKTIAALASMSSLPRSQPDLSGESFPGTTDPTLLGAMARNLELQAELDHFQREWRASGRRDDAVESALSDVHHRMTARAEVAAGIDHG